MIAESSVSATRCQIHAARNAPCLVIPFQSQQYQHIQSLKLYDAPLGFGPRVDAVG